MYYIHMMQRMYCNISIYCDIVHIPEHQFSLFRDHVITHEYLCLEKVKLFIIYT